MQILEVKDDGEVHEIKEEDKPIKDLLDSTKCYIMNDDDNRIVYLWKGDNSRVRGKFIGANKLQEIRGQVGLNYGTKSMDENEMDEFPDFQAAIEHPRTDGFAQEIIEDQELQFDVNSPDTGSTRTYKDILKKTGSGQYNAQIQHDGPLYKGGDSMPAGSGSSSNRSYSEEDLQKIIASLDEEGIPEGYLREMVLMGDTAYSIAEKKQNFLGKEQIERVLEPISSLPEGIFFADQYAPRVLVENKKIVAIEFLKKM